MKPFKLFLIHRFKLETLFLFHPFTNSPWIEPETLLVFHRLNRKPFQPNPKHAKWKPFPLLTSPQWMFLFSPLWLFLSTVAGFIVFFFQARSYLSLCPQYFVTPSFLISFSLPQFQNPNPNFIHLPNLTVSISISRISIPLSLIEAKSLPYSISTWINRS